MDINIESRDIEFRDIEFRIREWRSTSSVRRAGRVAGILLFACTMLLPFRMADAASSVTVLALFGDKALLHIDGEQRLLHAGDRSPEGVSLVRVESGVAVIEIDGREEALELGFATTFPGADLEPEDGWKGPDKVSLWADTNGFFYSGGTINGFPVRFLVDTGATSVAISSQLADRIGISYADQPKGVASTAGGITPMYSVVLDRVTVGGITLQNVDAGIVIGTFPMEPLLGMSFLGQVDMVREGDRMELKRRF